MNFPRNYRNMAGPRMFPGPRMGAPYFPTYNRSRVHQDFEFAENPDLHGNNFWVGPVVSKHTTGKVFHHAKQKKNKNKPFVPKQLPKVVEKEPVAPPEEKKTTENPKDVTNNPQNQQAISQPQNSGAPVAAKKPKPRKMNSFRKRGKKSKAAANNRQNHQATSQPQNSGVSKSAQQSTPAAGSQPHSSKDAAGKLQQPMPKDVSAKPEATNSLQPNPPCVSQPENADDKQQKKANAQNGDNKKRDAEEETRDADLPSQPHKKLKTEETGPHAEQ